MLKSLICGLVGIILLQVATCSGQAMRAGSRAASSALQDYMLNSGAGQHDKIVETGDRLFGTYKWMDEKMRSKVHDILSGKSPTDYQVGDWGFIGHRDITILSHVSKKECLVTVDAGFDAPRVLLLRGFDVSKASDGTRFILLQPVEISTTYSYIAVSGTQKTVLVAEANDQVIEKALAAVQEKANKQKAAQAEKEKRLQIEKEQRRKEATRIWTDATSNRTLKAEFLSYIAGKVKLKKEDGTVTIISMDRLCYEDQQWIQGRLKGKM